MCIRDRYQRRVRGVGSWVHDALMAGYAKLYGPNLVHYLNTHTLHLGREQKAPGEILQLADDKNISRKHATIQFEPARGLFELVVHGKNGATVAEPSTRVPVQITPGSQPYSLNSGTLIKIGSVEFVFLLPI
eukprot:TRINITY_DN17130_c0_g1_i14.p1 TRINITY_DN17130_c0_g1~~TRINITY_DN17130_c0_g1_i14.p1  ORF type:complete len:132 (+),score=33.40 TRINITY_DN17130_c0_g1_i14:68-463(+)